MLTTTRHDFKPTIDLGGDRSRSTTNELISWYDKIAVDQRISWTGHHHFRRLLGQGGQGSVYLSDLRGADQFTVPVAIKVFSPERFEDARGYSEAMGRMARVASRAAMIQHDNLLDIHNFIDRHQIRMMIMEWVDGYDLHELLKLETLQRIERSVSVRRWDYINRVIVTSGVHHARLQPGIAVAIVRDCLSGLAALHREGIAHGDVKPSNIMLKRTGSVKIIDLGSAFSLEELPTTRTCTPVYAAPEVLESNELTPLSDLASLGYVLIEMMSGRALFRECTSNRELLEAKRSLPQRLHELLPEDVTVNDLLMRFCRGLIAPDPMLRFSSAESAELHKEGAASFLRQLIIGDLASEYRNEIRLWLEELRDQDELSE